MSRIRKSTKKNPVHKISNEYYYAYTPCNSGKEVNNLINKSIRNSKQNKNSPKLEVINSNLQSIVNSKKNSPDKSKNPSPAAKSKKSSPAKSKNSKGMRNSPLRKETSDILIENEFDNNNNNDDDKRSNEVASVIEMKNIDLDFEDSYSMKKKNGGVGNNSKYTPSLYAKSRNDKINNSKAVSINFKDSEFDSSIDQEKENKNKRQSNFKGLHEEKDESVKKVRKYFDNNEPK